MAKPEAVVEEKSTEGARPAVVQRRRRWSTPVKVGAAILIGGALFAGGVLVANQFGGSDSIANQAADVLVLQQMGQLTQQADAVIAKVQAADPNALQTQQGLGVELQTVAVALDALPAQAQNPELKEVSQMVADGYLDLSIGLVTNNARLTKSGADTLATSRDRLQEYLGTQTEQPQGDAPAGGTGSDK